jgi:ATP-dependent Clp protease protease subunit
MINPNASFEQNISSSPKKILQAPTRRRVAPEFIPKPARTLEWLGGVTYNNLENTLAGIKRLIAEDSKEEIQLLISSFGGATGIGMTFYDTIRALWKPNLCTIGSGDVDSSGIIVFLSGQKRFLTPNTTMLLHLGGRTFDKEKRFSTLDMENMLKEDRLKDLHYASVISEATNGKHSTEKIMKLMAQNTILTAEEAVNMGLAHRVLRQ